MTLGPAPPPGKYSSGSRGTLSATPEHPAAPSRDTPAAPAPAALKKSLRVSAPSVLLLNPENSSHHSQKANCNRKARSLRSLVSTPPCGRLVSMLQPEGCRSSATLRLRLAFSQSSRSGTVGSAKHLPQAAPLESGRIRPQSDLAESEPSKGDAC